MGAGVVLVVAVEELVKEPTALVLSTAALSFLAQPARTAAKQQLAMRVVRFSVNIEPPGSDDGRFCSAGAERRTYGRRGIAARRSWVALSPGLRTQTDECR